MFSISGTGGFSPAVLKGPRIVSASHRFSFHVNSVSEKFYYKCFLVCDVFVFLTMVCDVC
jgi:hypothetical protein